MICGFVEKHVNPMLLSLQIIAMLTWKEMPSFEILQIAYCVNCRKTNVPGYCCQQSIFFGAFSLQCRKDKAFMNVRLHCIVSNVPSKVRKNSRPPELLLSEISFSRTCNIPRQWKLHRKQGTIWIKCLVCSYFDNIVYLLCNSQSL